MMTKCAFKQCKTVYTTVVTKFWVKWK